MATPVIMPRQGQSVESCIIAKWHKKKGDKVAKDDVLFTYETDKATFDEEAKEEGILLDVFFEEGDDIPCLTNVCVIGKEGESAEEFRPKSEDDEAPAEEAKKEEATVKEAAPVETVARAEGEFIRISPRARKLAERNNVDYKAAPASGPHGRIVEKDIEYMIDNKMFATSAAMDGYVGSGITSGTGLGGRVTTADLAGAAAPAASALSAAPEADFEEAPITNIRKVIAKAMHASLSNMAQLTLNTSFDATEIMAFRKKIKNSMDAMGLSNITFNDIVLYAVSRVLLKHKYCNAHYLDDKMKFFNNAHIGMAVDTERGLLVPTIFNANKMSLNDISKAAKELAKKAQEGSIAPDLLTGASFTVTNLGSLGIESFTPVINPPQTCILGVDSITTKVKEVNGEIKTYPSMGLSLTFDHRALDGAPAAKFLKELATSLENFSVMLSI